MADKRESERPVAELWALLARYKVALLLALVLGLGARLWLCAIAPERGYTWDHFDIIGMGRTAAAAGLFQVYSVEREGQATVHGRAHAKGKTKTIDRVARLLPNYPPLTIAILYGQTALLDRVQAPLFANTFLARLVMASVPFAFELLAALALMGIVLRLGSQRAALVAGLLLWCFPPVMMNSCLWGQVDAYLLGPAVLACWLMIERRWLWAGAVLGLCVLLKPQGFILGPVAIYGLLLHHSDEPAPKAKEVGRRLGLVVAAATATVVVVSLPWTLADGLAWLERCYLASFLETFPETTMYAFNVWYLDALRLDGELVFALDSSVELLGLSKDAWGRLLVLAAGAGAAALCWWRYRGSSTGLVLFAGLWLLGVFVWPTRVHERFVLYCVPFVIAAAVLLRWYRPILLGLLILGAAEHSWNQWMVGPHAGTLLPRRSNLVHKVQLAKQAHERRKAQGAVQSSAPPSLEQAERSLIERVRPQRPRYLAARQRVWPFDLLLTLLTMLCYAGALAAAAFGQGRARHRRE